MQIVRKVEGVTIDEVRRLEIRRRQQIRIVTQQRKETSKNGTEK